LKNRVFSQQVSTHLKNTRKARGLSLDATSALTGVSKAMLGQIERQESSPTIATLWKIATGLETSFSAFLTSDNGPPENNFPDDPDMKIKVLFPWHSDTRIEVFEVTLDNFHQQESQPHVTGTIEHIILMSGELSVYFDGQWQKLAAGEQLRFSAAQAHGYKSLSKSCQFHLIVSYPATIEITSAC